MSNYKRTIGAINREREKHVAFVPVYFNLIVLKCLTNKLWYSKMKLKLCVLKLVLKKIRIYNDFFIIITTVTVIIFRINIVTANIL